MITAKEIAKICGVSSSTVSNILNGRPNVGEETRKRVLEVIKEMGYHPNYFASNMRKQNTKIISVIAEDLSQFTTLPIVATITAYCEDKGYRTILIDLRMYDRWQDTWYEDEEKLSSFLWPALNESEAIKVDGIIYIAGHGREIKCFPEQMTVPMVVAYAYPENDRFPSVLIDDEKGGYEIGKYITSMGHKNIGIITGVEDNMHTNIRLTGFKKALSEANVEFHPEWVRAGGWQREDGYRLAPELLKNDISIIWCMNDEMASGVYDYLHEHKMEIGKEISVAGFDYMDKATYLYPKLTTNRLPLEEIGKCSVETIIKMIENEGWQPEQMKQWLPCEMKIGNSVKRMTI